MSRGAQPAAGLVVQYGVAGLQAICDHRTHHPEGTGCVYGPVAPAVADRLTRSLRIGDDPGSVDPLVPWAAAVQRADGIAVTASTMLPSGIFWAVDEGDHGPILTVATDPGNVVANRPEPTVLDPGWLRALSSLTAPPDRTPYRGINRLLPGHTLFWRPGTSPRLSQWCGPRAWAEAPRRRVTVARYRDQFEAVVDAISAAAPGLAAQVSGGLDSTFAVAVAAANGRLRAPLQAYLSVPLREAPIDAGRRIGDETSYCADLAAKYPGRLHVTRIANTVLTQPLDAAAAHARVAWWPTPAASNQVWIAAIQRAAAHAGAEMILSGQSGNFSFSPYHPPRGLNRRLHRALRRAGPDMPTPDRTEFLTHLAGHARPHLGTLNPAGVNGLLHADPYRARPILDLAAAISDRQWGCEPWPRGFARRVAAGRVPDSIRLRVARGAQAPDVWWWIKDQRERYLDEAALLTGSEVAADLDVAALRAELQAWPWGQPFGPDTRDITRVHRILTTADFARSTAIRLRRMPPPPTTATRPGRQS